MTGTETTIEPDGSHRKPSPWISRVALIALLLAAVCALPGLARAAGPAANIDQCRNGTFASPNQCIDGAWENGNLGATNSHYREDDSVPFRALVTGLTTGATPHSLLIQYDTLQGGKHAYDYLRGYDQSETSADPTHDIAGQVAGNCFAIPADPTLVFTQPGAVQKPGNICIWNGTITGLVYGSADAAGQRSLEVNFTAIDASVVIAWGGHIASQLDWGLGNSASAISGSPYHMRLLTIDTTSLGNQDRSLKADAIPPIPNLSTQASSATFSLGNTVTDTATLTGANGAVTGTIQFQTCGPDLATNPACDSSNSTNFGSPVTIDVTGHAVSPAFTPAAVGRYCFRAIFTPASSAVYSPTAGTNTTTECFNVTAAGVNVVTAIHNAAHATVTTAAIGSLVHDSVSVTGPIGTPTGTVSFTVFLGSTTCSGVGTAAGSGTLSSGLLDNVATTATVPVGGLSYLAHYNGDAKYAGADGACEPLEGTKVQPAISTNASATVQVGGSINDSVVLSGGLNPTGTVTVKVFGPDDSTCSQAALFSDDITVNGDNTYPSPTHVINNAGTYRFVASYGGDGSNNAIPGVCNAANESVVVGPKQPTIDTTASSAVEVGGSINDSVVLAGGLNPTGTVTVKVFGPNDATCSQAALFTDDITVSSGNGTYPSPAHVINVAGTYRFVASYSGDANNSKVDAACNAAHESVVVGPKQPTIVTAASSAVEVGGSINDSVTLSGAFNPTGTITVKVFGPDDATCSQAALFRDDIAVSSGNGTYPSPAHVINQAGTYRFVASYGGDANNSKVDGACNAANESVAVGPKQPTIDTTASSAVEVGGSINDSVVLAGGLNPTGTITVKVFGPDDATCSQAALFTDQVTVSSGNGTYPSPAHVINQAGTYRFVASYGGDANNSKVDGACNAANESVIVGRAQPTISTELTSDHVVNGDSVNDSAILSGATGDAGGTVTYTVYNNTQCSTDGEGFSSHDAGTVNVTDGNVPDSSSLVFATPGNFRWQAVYSGDSNNAPATSPCESEPLVVSHPAISIVKGPKSQAIDSGGTANFTITVTNTGDIELSNVTVTDAQAPSCAKVIGDLAPGASSSYTCSLGGVTSPFTNSATATGHPAVGPDVSATDTAPVTVNAVPPPPPPPPPVVPAPVIDLQITKTDSPDPAVLGNKVRYLITVKNNGPSIAHNVQMSDPLPIGVSFSSVASTQGTCTGGQVISCQLGTIPNGASVVITVFVTTLQTGLITNTATTVGQEAESNTANNTASTTTLVKGPFKPPVITGCYAVAVTPHALTAGKRSTLTLSVHTLGKPAQGARVRVTGAGINKVSGKTNAKGLVKLSVKPAKPGILRFQPLALKGCSVPRIGVIGAFTPPVTG